MGYAIMIGCCAACRKLIQFNPHKVPSLMINGTRQAICEECAHKWNELHPNEARPILDGAYEPLDEDEL